MSIVTVKNKYQIVIPQNIREQVGIVVGDYLEAIVEKGRIIFQPKTFVDRGIAEGLNDIKVGRSYGPYNTHKEFLASLHSQSNKLKKK